MAPLRILHVLTHDRVKRGGAIQALLLADHQRREGMAVSVVANENRDEPLHPTFRPWVERGLPVTALPLDRPSSLLRFRGLVRRFRPDVVHAHREIAGAFVAAARHVVPFPAAVVQRGTTHPFRNRIHRWGHTSRRIDRIIAVAQAVKDAMVRQGVDPAKIDVVYGSCDLDRFDPARTVGTRLREELGLAPGQPLVVQVGALHPKKSPEVFVEAAAHVLSERPDAVFALVGDGKRRQKVERRIESLGLEGRVRLLGFRSDIPEVYAACDVAVNCSSRHEGLTGALREALAMECPVVATATDGNPELVRHGETGLLVPVGDARRLADAVLELLEDRERARRLGRRGRELVRRLMHPDVRLARTLEVYERALRGARASASSVQASSRAIASGNVSSTTPRGSTENV